MKCKYCGAIIDNDADRCPYCKSQTDVIKKESEPPQLTEEEQEKENIKKLFIGVCWCILGVALFMLFIFPFLL
ncbi:MAG: hypothetical protein IKB30_02260 [Clostridia bacterium]|nr:hypothetical protein [Clostridia bacterium]